MNHQFRKKPVVIEAVQVVQGRAGVVGFSATPTWLERALHVGEVSKTVSALENDPVFFHVSTLEGTMNVALGDWIILGVEGELYPCKHSIFEATYEEVE